MKKSQKSTKRSVTTTIKRKEKQQVKLIKEDNQKINIDSLSIEKINELINVMNVLIQKELNESKDSKN
tara:strand:+ start:257 stop:460 length:204 start_codon:yes stop_codon:yes gene_type:complete